MKRKGDLVFWEISELTTTKEHLESLGFDRLVPRNDYRSAMIKALKKITKGNDKLYRRFNDKAEEVSFAIFEQRISESDILLDREITITIDKKTGALSTKAEYDGEFYRSIRDIYLNESKTIDSSQFRSMVLRVVQQECFGVPMRKGGGVYFIKESFDETQRKLNELFNAFPHQATLHRVPIYDDPSTLTALESAVSEDLTGDIESLVADINKRFEEGKITRRQLEGDQERIQKIVQKTEVHADALRAKASAIRAKLELAKKAVKSVIDKVESGIIEPKAFMKALGEL